MKILLRPVGDSVFIGAAFRSGPLRRKTRPVAAVGPAFPSICHFEWSGPTFFSPVRSCEPVGPRSEKSLLVFIPSLCVLCALALCALCVNSCLDRKSTRLNSSHVSISYAVFCLKKKNKFTQYKYNISNNNNV